MISVQVIEKSVGKYKMLKSIGSSAHPDEAEQLCKQGQEWIRGYGGQLDMLSLLEEKQLARHEMEETARVLDNIDNVLINRTQLILNHVFHCAGFDKIMLITTRHKLIARLFDDDFWRRVSQ